MDLSALDEPISKKQALLAFAEAVSTAFPSRSTIDAIREACKGLAPDLQEDELDEALPMPGPRAPAAYAPAAATPGRSVGKGPGRITRSATAAAASAAATTASPVPHTKPDAAEEAELARRIFVVLVSQVAARQQPPAEAAGGAAGDEAAEAEAERGPASMAAEVEAEWEALPAASRRDFAAAMRPVMPPLRALQRSRSRPLLDADIQGVLQGVLVPASAIGGAAGPSEGEGEGAGERPKRGPGRGRPKVGAATPMQGKQVTLLELLTWDAAIGAASGADLQG